MKKQTLIAMFVLFVFSAFLVGCGNAEETNQAEQTISTEATTVTLVEAEYVPVEKTQEVVVTRDTQTNVFLRSGVDAIIEFYNDDDVSKRLVIYDSQVDVVLRPNERIEVKINSAPQTLEYVFGDEYKQIIIV